MSTAPTITTDESPDSPEASKPSAPARPSAAATLRPLVLRLHFYAGVLVAPFLLVAALTGFLYAGSFQAEKIIYADELTVSVGDTKLPISEQVAAARKAHPQGTVAGVRPSPAAFARALRTAVAVPAATWSSRSRDAPVVATPATS